MEQEDKLTAFEEEVQIEMILYAGRKQRREIIDEHEYIRCAASRLLAHAREELKRLEGELRYEQCKTCYWKHNGCIRPKGELCPGRLGKKD